VLVKAVKQIDRDEGRLILCQVSPPIHEVLEISGFLGLLEVVDTRAQALEAMPS
jgi:stage II sporulation protein AA (anti-sigma F factor antagonist)